MITLTTGAHLASVRERLTAPLDEQSYNDLAVVALFYSTHATTEQRVEAALLYVEVVRKAAEARRATRQDDIA
jgi:hypothetical protein